MTKLWLALFAPVVLAAADSCVDCHGALAGPADVHLRAGIRCANCHGGDPNAADPESAMSRAKGFRGKPARAAVPQLCGKCHSDPAFMHRFKPQQRVDQLAQYSTSEHGRRLAKGDRAVATCIDCHGAHDVREVSDTLSPVHPARLPETCARCHADKARMAPYGIPVDQIAQYRTSVHWDALSKRGDLSAPGCASCHGSHGAAPPEVRSVRAVCGGCHVLQQQLYSSSPHSAVFDSLGIAGCSTCHDNHAVHRPTEALLTGAAGACARCHDPGSAGASVALETGRLLAELNAAIERSQTMLDKARLAGMEVSDASLRLRDANEALVRARVAVHAFAPRALEKPVQEGLAIARDTWQAGNAALQERDRRRYGLGFSLIAILATVLGLWLKLRQIEAKESMRSGKGVGV